MNEKVIFFCLWMCVVTNLYTYKFTYIQLCKWVRYGIYAAGLAGVRE